jgi:uncharacterized membrane protein YdbT with pleckstrin-like domain
MNRDTVSAGARMDSGVRAIAADKPLLKARRSWWTYFWYLFFCWLIVPLIIALWKRASLTLSVYENKVILERGVLSKQVTQVLISDIRSVDSRQGFGQRILRIGDILIGTAAMGGYEIVATSLPDPRGIAALIMRQRQLRGGSQD